MADVVRRVELLATSDATERGATMGSIRDGRGASWSKTAKTLSSSAAVAANVDKSLRSKIAPRPWRPLWINSLLHTICCRVFMVQPQPARKIEL